MTEAAMARQATLVADHDHTACIDAALDRAAELCARRGARLTRLRRRVLELVWQSHAAVKPPTVYRALDFLMAHGLVHRLESLNAYVGCPQPEAPHDGQFLICNACGHVSEFEARAIQTAIEVQAAGSDFAVEQRTVEVRGVCRGCRPAASIGSS
jgi:Fur family transcriptional regulator, zinc uptake regulator